jgi:hypothetical protein
MRSQVSPERETAEDFELAAQLQEALAHWAPSEEADCILCRHLTQEGRMTCIAFPNGIPWEIQSGAFDHHQSHPQDRGIRYAPITREELFARAARLRARAETLTRRGADKDESSDACT